GRVAHESRITWRVKVEHAVLRPHGARHEVKRRRAKAAQIIVQWAGFDHHARIRGLRRQQRLDVPDGPRSRIDAAHLHAPAAVECDIERDVLTRPAAQRRFPCAKQASIAVPAAVGSPNAHELCQVVGPAVKRARECGKAAAVSELQTWNEIAEQFSHRARTARAMSASLCCRSCRAVPWPRWPRRTSPRSAAQCSRGYKTPR